MYTNSSLSCSVLITLWKIALINLFYSYISCTAFIFRYQLNVLNFLSLEGELKVSRQKHVEQPLWNGLRSWDMRWAERRDILLQEGWEGERQTSLLYPLLASRASHAAQQLWRLGCQHCFPGPSCWVRKSLIVQIDGIQESLMLSSISNLGAQLLFLQQAWQIVQHPEDHIINTATQKRCATHLLRVHFPSLKKIHCLALFAVQWNSKSFFTISPQQQEKQCSTWQQLPMCCSCLPRDF